MENNDPFIMSASFLENDCKCGKKREEDVQNSKTYFIKMKIKFYLEKNFEIIQQKIYF